MKKVSNAQAEKIKFGLIGCSRISSQHFGSMIYFKDKIELVALSDITEAKAKEFGEKYKVPNYTDYKKMLKEEEMDIVSVCTPNGLHAEMAIACAKSGKHCLLEKPIALNVSEADEIIKNFEKYDKKLFVVKQVRFNPTVMVIKKLLEEGILGKIFSTNLTVRWTRPQSYFDEVPWRGTKKLDGGALLNQGDHYVDVLQWFLGPVKNVMAKTDMVAHQIETEDEVFAILHFVNGAYGTIEFTINTYPHNLECSITILGSKGSIQIGGNALDQIEIWEVENYPKPAIQDNIPQKAYELGLFKGASPRHLFIYQNVIDHFHNSKEITADGREAKKSIEIIQAIYQSSREKKQVDLPLII